MAVCSAVWFFQTLVLAVLLIVVASLLFALINPSSGPPTYGVGILILISVGPALLVGLTVLSRWVLAGFGYRHPTTMASLAFVLFFMSLTLVGSVADWLLKYYNYPFPRPWFLGYPFQILLLALLNSAGYLLAYTLTKAKQNSSKD